MDVRVGLQGKLRTKESMVLNCVVGEDSQESRGLQEIQPVHPKGNQSWIFIERTDAEAETPTQSRILAGRIPRTEEPARLWSIGSKSRNSWLVNIHLVNNFLTGSVGKGSVWILGFPCGSAGKESICNAGNLGSIPGLGRSCEERKDYPLQYSGLENSMDCVVHGFTKSQTPLSNFHFPGRFHMWRGN